MTPRTRADWIALAAISALGIAVLAWVLPLAARVPFMVPPDAYNRFTGNGAFRKPFAELMNVTPVFASVLIVMACALLFAWWMSRPVVIRPPKHRRQTQPGRGEASTGSGAKTQALRRDRGQPRG